MQSFTSEFNACKIKRKTYVSSFYNIGTLTYRCLGQKYAHIHFGNALSTFIVIPADDIVGRFSEGDILVSNDYCTNIEEIKEIRLENEAIFLQTELVQCDRSSSFSSQVFCFMF